MRSLRARIFLTVWPLFVLAMLAVGALSSRSARIELAQFESRTMSTPDRRATVNVADSIIVAWSLLRSAGSRALLQRLATRLGTPVHLLVLDTAGVYVASSDPSLAQATYSVKPTGDIEVTRTLSDGRTQQLQRLLLSGTPLVARDAQRLGRLYELPASMPRLSNAEVMASGIQRSVWLAVLLACVLAAVGTWLLAFPVVAQVQRLTTAASAVQAKALTTRVRVSSRDELGVLEDSFNRMAASLEQTEAAKRQLISDLAHELRTPLTNVIGLLHAMRDGLRPPDAATLRSTQDEALLLKQLIDELQELALADASGLRFDMQTLDAGVELQRAVDAFQACTPAITVVRPSASVPVHADPRRLAQVLRNVLQNALTHTPADGRITATLRQDGAQVVIEIADTGRGIPAEHLPHIWERFYRVDASRDRATGGMGLGLALTRRMVEGMGGAIGAVSQVGEGTTITVQLRRSELRHREA